MSIVLVGMMGCGKSHIGRLLAQTLNIPLHDSDSDIEEREGQPISDIFSEHGEPYFRDLETEVLRSYQDAEPHVISTGGGAVLRDGNMQIMKRIGLVVWLNTDIETLFERVSRNKKRPLLQVDNPKEALEALAREREPFYAASDVEIKCSARDAPEAVCEKIMKELSNRL